LPVQSITMDVESACARAVAAVVAATHTAVSSTRSWRFMGIVG
jgi:hypothetical protein